MKKLIIGVIVLGSVLLAQDAKEIMEKNGCFACHAMTTKKKAPAFACIGKRNLRFEGTNAKEVIINSIKNGSQGKYPRFSGSVMPPYKNLSSTELSLIAEYILEHANECKGHGRMNGMGMGGGLGRGMR